MADDVENNIQEALAAPVAGVKRTRYIDPEEETANVAKKARLAAGYTVISCCNCCWLLMLKFYKSLKLGKMLWKNYTYFLLLVAIQAEWR